MTIEENGVIDEGIHILYKTDRGIGNKWPQMFTTGKTVTSEQAKEIIRRTDLFFVDFSDLLGGNNQNFNNSFLVNSGKKRIIDDVKDDWPKMYGVQEKFEEEWKHVSTSYVSNCWASSSFIGGPHGWCHPDGTISFKDNIGKWPSLEDVVEDWKNLLVAFPFLEVNVTLFDGESCQEEAKPTVSLSIGDKKIVIHENHDIHDESRSENPNIDNFIEHMNCEDREQGLSNKWIKDFANKSASICDKLVISDKEV